MMFDFSANNINNYELVKEEFLSDLNSQGLLLRHKKSGARVLVLSNDDENKVFSIGFRTPPYSDTGLQHIIEHSVLCGSRKYPVKDPFVELCKGSLNTFLNAMTYPDKTVYPVASCNLTDFKNIMDVYMDAVFYPNIYNREEIFMQEGWHYAMESEEAPLEYNGVVYNEMKGVYSSADDVLSRYVFGSLFPDNAYCHESGGDPEVIPQLTYEEFLEYHRQYYHPSNSYIYLYGDMDVNERLEYLNDEYLKDFEYNDKDTTIKVQKSFDKPVRLNKKYAVTKDEPLENNSYLSINWVVGDSLDARLYLAMQIIDYVLVSSTGGVLKTELIDRRIGLDVDGSYESSIYQPMYSVTCHNANDCQLEEFESVVSEKLAELVEKGIDKDLLLAGLNYYEFRYREADFGHYPKGLMYGLQIFDSWLYDENAPFVHIEAGKTFEFLRSQIDKGYFENIIKEYLIDNNHKSIVTLSPQVDLTKEKEEALAAKLAQYKASLTPEEIKAIVERTKALEEYQEEPSSQEELETIPMLGIEDIEKETQPLYNDVSSIEDVTVVHHNLFTNRINYLCLAFDAKCVPDDMIEYLGLLNAVLGEMDTENYTYAQLSNVININSGGFSNSVAIYTDSKNLEFNRMLFEAKIKVLYDKTDFAFDIMKEILLGTKLGDYKRLKELISKMKSRMETSMASAGHTVAMLEANSQFSKGGNLSNRIRGYAFYKFVNELDKNFESVKEDVVSRLQELVNIVFAKSNLTVSITSDDEGFDRIKEPMADFVTALNQELPKEVTRQYNLGRVRLGLTSSSQVQYVARCGNYIADGYKYTGALRVLKVIFSYEYLWNNVRVKGGAYGCMSGFSKGGDVSFVSYRDPNLGKTNQVYENAAEYIRTFDVSNRDMVKFIIGTMGEIDMPLNARAKGVRSFTAYLCNVTQEDFQQERDEILGCNAQKIRSLAPMIDCAMKQNYFCVVGNEENIRKETELFDKITSLIG